MVVRYVRDEEVIAQAINTTRRGLRDAQRPTGTEINQTTDVAAGAAADSEYARQLADDLAVVLDTLPGQIAAAQDAANTAADEAGQAKDDALAAMNKALANEGGIAGALSAISSLDIDLSGRITTAQSKADQAVTELSTERGRINGLVDDLGIVTNTTIPGLQTTINGKNKTFRSHLAPTVSTPGGAVGDTWWRYKTSALTGEVIGQWSWSGAAWVSSPVGSEAIANVTVDKLVVTGGAKIPVAVIDSLVTDQAFISSIYANRLIIAPTDFAPGPAGYEAAWSLGSAAVIQTDSLDVTGRAIVIAPTVGATSTRMVFGPKQRVTPGEKILVEFRGTWLGAGNPDALWNARMIWYDAAGVALNSTGTLVIETDQNVNVSQVVTVPANAVFGAIRFYTNPGDFRNRVFRNLNIVKQVGAILLEDGVITGTKVNAQSVAAAVGEFVTVKASNLVADTGAMNSAFVRKLVTDQTFSSLVYTNALVVAATDLAPGPGGYEGAWDISAAGASIKNSPSDTSGRRLALTIGTAATRIYGPTVRVVGGGKISFAVTMTAVGSPNAFINCRLRFYDSAGTQISDVEVKRVSGSSATVDEVVDVPANAMTASVAFAANGAASPQGEWAPVNIRVRPQVGAILLENGAITSPKISSDAVQAMHIASDAITSRHIKVGALDGLVITGAHIRTKPDGQRRVVLGAGTNPLIDGVWWQNAQGAHVITVQAGSTTGSEYGMWFNDDTGTSTVGQNRMFIGAKAGAATGVIITMRDAAGNPRIGIDDAFNGGFFAQTTTNYSRVNSVGLYSGYYSGGNSYVRFRVESSETIGKLELWGGSASDHGLWIYDAPTTTSAANVHWSANPNGRFYRTTSLRRFKNDIEPLADMAGPYQILDVAPVTWIDATQELEQAEAQLVQDAVDGGVSIINPDYPFKVAPLRRIPGWVAEDMEAAGLGVFCQYDENDELVGISYDRIAAALSLAVAENKRRIDALEAALAA